MVINSKDLSRISKSLNFLVEKDNIYPQYVSRVLIKEIYF